jgi:hypothetical protein
MEVKPLHTTVEKTIQANVGMIVLENPGGFPRDKSNLYCIGQNDKIIWTAEKPDANVMYSRVKLNEDGGTLSAYTTGGHACEIDLFSGKLVSQLSFK